MNLLSKLTGRQHHFRVALRYYYNHPRSPDNIERVVNVWLPNRRSIADERLVKQTLAPDMFEQMARYHKRNGILVIRAVYYLGWFKPIKRG